MLHLLHCLQLMLPLCSFISQQVERVLEKTDRLRSDMFGELLQAANTIGDLRNCPVYKLLFSLNKLHGYQMLTHLFILSYLDA